MTTLTVETPDNAEAPAAPAAPIGALLRELRQIKDAREGLAEQDKALSVREAQLRRALIGFHEQTGVLNVADHGLSVSFSPGQIRVGYVPEKWDDLQRWLVDNGYGYCVQRRLNEAKVRELIANGVALPEGVKVETFTDLRVLRKNG